MTIRETLASFASNIQTWSKVKIAAVFGILLVGGYVLAFVLPRPVAFSYAQETCVGRLTLFPVIQSAQSDSFEVAFRDGFSIGNTQVVATGICFNPTTAPKEGSTSVSVAPWGGPIFRAQYTLNISAPPKVLAAKTTEPIAITKPLLYEIDQTDTVFDYTVVAGEKHSSCSVSEKTVSCELKELELQQGAEHTVALHRAFEDESDEQILTTDLEILPAVTLTDASLKNDQVLYDKPSGFSFTTDKVLVGATAELIEVGEESEKHVDVTTTVKDGTVLVALGTELAREKTFRLTLVTAEATDGSTIPEPHQITFTTSGGPKIASVSVGSAGVDPNARIVVSLDQPVADTIDIAKFASVAGVAATVSKKDNQVIFSLRDGQRCAAFSLSIKKGVTSGSNGLVSKDDWVFNSRINCKATETIGYSVKGRPIVAYYYGSGATTVLYTGGMHGSEPSGTTTLQAWAAHLDVNAYKIPAGKQVVIVPNTNPDGVAAGSRYNANNVNLARNYATRDWKADIETASGTVTNGGGTAPMSEPETRALANLTSRLNLRVEVSFHAQGRLVGANDYADSRSIGTTYASLVGYRTMFGNSAEDIMGYGFSGQYEDWIGEKFGRPAILIELPTHKGNYLSSNLSALWKMVNL